MTDTANLSISCLLNDLERTHREWDRELDRGRKDLAHLSNRMELLENSLINGHNLEGQKVDEDWLFAELERRLA